MSSTMRAVVPHPDDPRPLRRQFRRVYPLGTVAATWTGAQVLQSANPRGWRPACWHRPLDRWWGEGGGPLLPPPVEERWPTFGPRTGPR